MLEMNGSEKYNKAANDLKELMAKQASEEIQTMDEDTLKAIQAVLGFIDATESIIAKQEEALKTIDEQLNELLLLTRRNKESY